MRVSADDYEMESFPSLTFLLTFISKFSATDSCFTGFECIDRNLCCFIFHHIVRSR